MTPFDWARFCMATAGTFWLVIIQVVIIQIVAIEIVVIWVVVIQIVVITGLVPVIPIRRMKSLNG